MLRALKVFSAAAIFALVIVSASWAGDKAPNFTVIDEAGSRVDLSSFLGKPVIVNFWATWCPPCREELPAFDKIASERSDVQFMMVDLTDGRRETVDRAKDFVKSAGYKFPVFFDVEYQGALAYGIRAIPTTVVVDANGEIEELHIGGLNEATLRGYVERVAQKR